VSSKDELDEWAERQSRDMYSEGGLSANPEMERRAKERFSRDLDFGTEPGVDPTVLEARFGPTQVQLRFGGQLLTSEWDGTTDDLDDIVDAFARSLLEPG
jgi:hypothetical protein